MLADLIKPLENQYILDSDAAYALFADLAEEATEVMAFAYFDPEWRLLGTRQTRSGLTTLVEVPVRTVAMDALALEAVSVVMAHNHPSGDNQPSDMDIAATKKVWQALSALDVKLIDHLVLTRDGYTSFREQGLL